MDINFLYYKIYSKIKNAKNILVVTHENPDADAISSVCALLELLEKMGKKYFAFCKTQPADYFRFLPHAEKIKSDLNLVNFASRDLILILDCGDLKRTNLAEEIKTRNKNQFLINIDHHPKVDDFANLEVKKEAASTTELIYEFYKANKIPISKNSALSILTGLSGDTGNFIYPATNETTMQISSEMMSRGARLPLINKRITRNKSLSSLKIWGKAMSRLKINKKYNLAFTILTADEINESKVEEEDLEGIASFLGNISDVKAILFLREEQPGNALRGSFRTTKPTINISLLARALGGGGHSKAAGFKTEGRLEEDEGKWRVI